MSLVAGYALETRENEVASAEFDRVADQAVLQIEKRLDSSEFALLSMRALFAASEHVDDDEFGIHTRMLAQNPALSQCRAFGYLEAKQVLAAPDSAGRDRLEPGLSLPGGHAGEYALRFLVDANGVPVDREQEGLVARFDAASLNAAIVGGSLLTSVRSESGRSGPERVLHCLLPIYQQRGLVGGKRPPGSSAFYGFVYLSRVLDDSLLVDGFIEELVDARIDAMPDRKSPAGEPTGTRIERVSAATGDGARYERVSRFEWGGHTWRTVVASTSAFESENASATGAAVSVFGCLLSVVFGAMVASMRQAKVSAEILAARIDAERTHEAARHQAFRSALDGTICYSRTDLHGVIHDVNDAFCHTTGYTQEELIGETHRLLRSGVHSREFFRDMWNTIGRGETWRGTICNRARDESYLWMDTVIAPLFDARGRPEGYESVRIDVTERQQAHEHLRNAYRMLEEMRRIARLGGWLSDDRMDTMSWSDGVDELFGLCPDDSATWDLLRVQFGETSWKAIRGACSLALESDAAQDVTVELADSGPQAKVVRMRCRSTTLLHGGRGLQGVFQDVTAEHQKMQELAAVLDESRRANTVKDEFLSKLSHELRTPLIGIIGATELLLLADDNQAHEEELRMISGSGAELMRVINRLLLWTEIQADAVALIAEEHAVEAIVGKAVRQFQALAGARGLELRCEIGEDVPETIVADGERMHTVLEELLDNAIRFSESGAVEVRVESEPGASDRSLRITIQDSGPGIHASEREELLEAFRQADNSSTRRAGGLGLGLPIVSSLLQLMGGEVQLEGQVGSGSRFVVSVPVEAAASLSLQQL